MFLMGAMIVMNHTAAAQVPDAASDPRINHQVPFLQELNKDSSPFWELPGPQVRATLSGIQNKTPIDLSGITVTEPGLWSAGPASR